MKVKAVEQVSFGTVSIAEGRSRSPKQLLEFFKQFGQVGRAPCGIWLNASGQKLLILAKNVSYLGYPHPLFKKRIQIPNTWNTLLKDQNTLLIGVYTGPEEDLVVLFANANFQDKKLNNSSAHVYTMDLLKGSEDGYFSKVDGRGNFIQVFQVKEFHEFLKSYTAELNYLVDVDDQLRWYRSRSGSKQNVIQPCIDFGRDIIGKTWPGIMAYREMHLACYSKAYEAEWAGWYNEFRFERFVSKPKYKQLVEVHSPKLGLDLDLLFLAANPFPGDLKAHTNHETRIIGNDLSTLKKAVLHFGKFWLVVTEHSTIKDKEMGLVTREFWNEIKREAKKGNPDADYSGRMKFSVTITGLMILEINHANLCYVTKYAQGKQPDGSPRNLKFAIEKKSLDNFVLYRSTSKY